MNSNPPSWLHCNVCFNQEAPKYKMTNCGTVFCSSKQCLEFVTTRNCRDCKGPCKRHVDLDDAPAEVRSLFEPISSQLSRSVIGAGSYSFDSLVFHQTFNKSPLSCLLFFKLWDSPRASVIARIPIV